MTTPNDPGEARLRQMFHDAAIELHPTRPAPDLATWPRRAPRGAFFRLSLGLAVCLLAAAAITVVVRPWGGSRAITSGDGAGAGGSLLTVQTNGAVEFLSPDTGAILRTLVGPSPVDSVGRHLSQPDGVTVADKVAYVSYVRPTPVIESIPLAGGTPQYVTEGMDPSASADGRNLAFYRLSDVGSEMSLGSSSGSVIVRDLATGQERTVYAPAGFSMVSSLSWSSDDSELAVSGFFMPGTTRALLRDTLSGVQLLELDQPLSATNPHFVGTPTTLLSSGPTWTDARFLGSGDTVGVLVTPRASSVCQKASTGVLSVDARTGRATTMATLPYNVSDAVFDRSGAFVAFQRVLPPQSCSEPTTTTTTTTTTTVPGRITIGTSGGATAVRTQWALYRWSAGVSTRLANNVAAVTFVPAS